MPLLEKAAPDARVITVSSGGMYTEPLNKDLQASYFLLMPSLHRRGIWKNYLKEEILTCTLERCNYRLLTGEIKSCFFSVIWSKRNVATQLNLSRGFIYGESYQLKNISEQRQDIYSHLKLYNLLFGRAARFWTVIHFYC